MANSPGRAGYPAYPGRNSPSKTQTFLTRPRVRVVRVPGPGPGIPRYPASVEPKISFSQFEPNLPIETTQQNRANAVTISPRLAAAAAVIRSSSPITPATVWG
ncbi:hypothetical protein LWI28_015726 [Acer negundo]|uniref:Uncharacterized protein n=1 Tax=Acer negundo TaxID=4023 RepID=A0AAD5I704_ACENE|nr:hypothetical protein LWI28_015726 [Acer negundo]